jgi:AsmA protein
MLENGRLDAELAETALLDGSLAAALSADATAAPAALEVMVTAGGIEAGPFAVAFGPFSSAALPVSARLDLSGAGDDRAALVDSLNGTLSASLAGGAFALPDPAIDASAVDFALELAGLDGPLTGGGSLTLNGEAVAWSLEMAAPRALLAGDTSAMALSLDSGPLTAAFDGRAGTAPAAQGSLELAVPSIPALLAWLPGPPAGEMPVEQLDLAAQVDLTPTRVGLSQLSGTVDGAGAAGELAVDTGAGVPSLYARLQLGRLELDRYLAGGDGAAAPAGGDAGADGGGTGADGGGWSDEPIDVSALRRAAIDAVVSADAIVARGTEVGPTEITVRLGDGVLRVTAPAAPVFGGTAAVDLTLDGSSQVPSLALQASADGVQARPLLANFAGTDRLSGSTDAAVDVTASGISERALVESLDGGADLLFRDGALSGINIAAILRNPLRYLRQGPPSEAPSTDFAEFGGSFAIADGIATTDNLRMLAPLFRVEGGGTISLAPQTLDLRLMPTVVPTLEGQGGEFQQAGLQVPILIQGPVSQPTIRPDFSELAVDIIGDREQAGQAIERLRQGASPQEILGDFLGRGDQQQDGDGGDGGQGEAGTTPEDRVEDAIRGLFSR